MGEEETENSNTAALPQQHQTIIEEPPFPPSSELDITATTADDECPSTDNIRDNQTFLTDRAGLQYTDYELTQGDSHGGMNTVHATMVQDETEPVVTAQCVPEATPIDASIVERKNIKIDPKSRKTQMALVFSLVVIIALAVGIGITASSSGGGDSGNNTDDSKSEKVSTLSASSSTTTERPSLIPSAQPSLSPSVSNAPTAAPIWIQVGQDMTGIRESELFGFAASVSKDGRRLAIGSPLYYDFVGNSSTAVELGRVAIYDDVRGEYWNLTGDILGDISNGKFGVYTTFSGDGSRIAIGANAYNVNQTGQVKVFEYKYGSWEPLGEPIIGDTDRSRFGTSLAFSDDGNILAASATFHDGLNGTDVGLVRIFEYSNGSWTGMGDPFYGEGDGDKSGHRISLSNDGRVLAIGAQHNGGVNGPNSGHVRVYQYVEEGNSKTWRQLGQDIDGEERRDRFGWSVDLSSDGSILAAGARRSDTGGEDSGAVWIYRYNNESDKWDVFGRISGEAMNDSFGHEVSLSSNGNVIAVGAINHDGINGDDSGYVQIYKYDSREQEWAKVRENIYGKGPGDQFGSSVSVSGDGARVAIGAPFNDDAGLDSGMVQVYEIANYSSLSS